MQDRSTSKQYESNAREEVIQPKYEEKGMKSIHPTADTVSSTAEFLTRNRIEEHIISLRKQDDNNVIIPSSIVFSLNTLTSMVYCEFVAELTSLLLDFFKHIQTNPFF